MSLILLLFIYFVIGYSVYKFTKDYAPLPPLDGCGEKFGWLLIMLAVWPVIVGYILYKRINENSREN